MVGFGEVSTAIDSEIGGRQTGLLGNASEHARADLFVIVKGEHDIWPAVAVESPMRPGCSFDLPADPKKACQNAARLRRRPSTHAAWNVTLTNSDGASRCSRRSAITRNARA